MKRTLILVLLLSGGLGAWAQDATTLQVAPSDQVIYPDASQILNKTPPKVEPKAAPPQTTTAASPGTATPGVPTTKPLVAAQPVLAAADKAAPSPGPGGSAKTPASVHGWYLSWTVGADEAGARAWAQALNRDFQVVAAGEGRWQVLVGPIDPSALATVKDLAGLAVLVHR
jgi:hypothetical protein